MSNMSGMQLRLQRELFTPQNEQLLSMVHCLRVEKEKSKPTKDIFLGTCMRWGKSFFFWLLHGIL